MAEHIDKEIDAIRAVLHALDPLTPEVRASVLKYVIGRLQIAPGAAGRSEFPESPASSAVATRGTVESVAASPEPQETPPPIKDLKEEKKPRSANEMAVLVAYYLENLVPAKERKDIITTKEIDTYFKIAGFRLPEKTKFTLPNAKAAGYLDAVGNGEYKLNAVGYNLVVHSMPRGTGTKTGPKRKRAKTAKPAAKKKVTPTTKKKTTPAAKKKATPSAKKK